jgi:hypothetical protein
MNEREPFNEIQTIDFDDIIAHPQNIHYKKNIWNLLKHLRIFSKYFITFGSNCAIQGDQIFSTINFMGTLSLFFTLNLTLFHHPFVSSFKWTKHQSQLIS